MGKKKQQRALLRRSAAAASADADAGTETRRTTATITDEFDTDHGDHSNCRSTCVFNFPPGCLHFLHEHERDSPEIKKYMNVLSSYNDFIKDAIILINEDLIRLWWDHPENKSYVNKTMVRVILFGICKYVTQKDNSSEYRSSSKADYMGGVMSLIGAILCGGSMKAFMTAEAFVDHRRYPDRCSPPENASTIPPNDIKVAQAIDIITDIQHEDGHMGLLHLLISMNGCCSCIREELKIEQQRIVQRGVDIRSMVNAEEGRSLLMCSYCYDREEVEDSFNFCSGCGVMIYCDRSCQIDGWKGVGRPVKHREYCGLIRKIMNLDF